MKHWVFLGVTPEAIAQQLEVVLAEDRARGQSALPTKTYEAIRTAASALSALAAERDQARAAWRELARAYGLDDDELTPARAQRLNDDEELDRLRSSLAAAAEPTDGGTK